MSISTSISAGRKPRRPAAGDLTGKTIVLIVGGGIAAYKSLDLTRRLAEAGAEVHGVMTQAAAQFITPLSLAALSGRPVREKLFDAGEEAQMGHIALARLADLIIIAPATAGRLAKLAAGLADDLAGALVLARSSPILLAPAMNNSMWRNPACQRALAQLKQDGMVLTGPDEGSLACGETGEGRLAEPADIVAAASALLNTASPLKHLRALVTSGPTHEAIDPVRYIANRSSGKQGHAIARALAAAGAETLLVSGCAAEPPPINPINLRGDIKCQLVETAADMFKACDSALPVDIAVCAAAVADWRVKNPARSKLKKAAGEKASQLDLVRNPDILAHIAAAGKKRPRLVIGFAAETDNLLANAKAKRQAKGCDWIIANDVSPDKGVLGGDENQAHIIDERGTESWQRMSKQKLAEKLVSRIAGHFGRG